MGSSASSSGSTNIKCDSDTTSFYDQVSKDISDNQAELLLESTTFNENNPGTFEELQKITREITPNFFDGAKMNINIPIYDFGQYSANWVFNDRKNKFYNIINFAGSRQIRAFERTPLTSIEFDFFNNLNLSFLHYFNKNLRFRSQIQSSNLNIDQSEFNLCYFGKKYSLSGTLINPSINFKSNIFAIQGLYRLLNNVDIGLELAGEFGKIQNLIPTGAFRISHGINKYKVDEGILSSIKQESQGCLVGIIGLGHFQFFYSRFMAPGFQFLSSLVYSPENPEQPSVASFGYMFSLPKHDLVVRSSLDTSLTIQTSVEKYFKEGEDGVGLVLSIAHNFSEGRTVTGIGASIGR